jgi:hypothetical protein
MYSKSTHFLLEFIQNVDNNNYADGVTPMLHLKLENHHIHVEVGFTEENVRAICKISISTKMGQTGYIGTTRISYFVSLSTLM